MKNISIIAIVALSLSFTIFMLVKPKPKENVRSLTVVDPEKQKELEWGATCEAHFYRSVGAV